MSMLFVDLCVDSIPLYLQYICPCLLVCDVCTLTWSVYWCGF